MYCAYCGKKIADGSRFCQYCGKKQPDSAPISGNGSPAAPGPAAANVQQPGVNPAGPGYAAGQPGTQNYNYGSGAPAGQGYTYIPGDAAGSGTGAGQPSGQAYTASQPSRQGYNYAPGPTNTPGTHGALGRPGAPAGQVYTAAGATAGYAAGSAAQRGAAPAGQGYGYTPAPAAPARKPRRGLPGGILLWAIILLLLIAIAVMYHFFFGLGNTEHVLDKAASLGESQKAIHYLDKACKLNKDEAIKTERDRIYYSQWKVSKRTFLDPATGDYTYRSYYYDKETGKLIRTQFETPNENVNYEAIVEEKAPNHQVWTGLESEGEAREEIYLNEKGQEVLYEYYGEDGELTTAWRSEYNDHGDLILEAYVSGDGEASAATFISYEYEPGTRNKTETSYYSDLPEPTVAKWTYNEEEEAYDIELVEGENIGLLPVRVEFEYIPLPEEAEPTAPENRYTSGLRMLKDGEAVQKGDFICYELQAEEDGEKENYRTAAYMDEEYEVLYGKTVGQKFSGELEGMHFTGKILAAARLE